MSKNEYTKKRTIKFIWPNLKLFGDKSQHETIGLTII